MLVIARAVRRQADTARGAVEQAHAQQAFEVLDDGGDGGARKREAVGRPGEAIGVHDAHKHLHSLKTVHGDGVLLGK
ncbi:hypothetical protein D3C81_1881020 [compost metagenome]